MNKFLFSTEDPYWQLIASAVDLAGGTGDANGNLGFKVYNAGRWKSIVDSLTKYYDLEDEAELGEIGAKTGLE
jgi:hypothetical protein